MVAIHNPLIDMEADESAMAYIGVLERQVLGLTVQELRFRALLEMLTGEDWSDLALDLENGELEKIAVNAMEAKGMDRRKARRVVKQRIQDGASNAAYAEQQPHEG